MKLSDSIKGFLKMTGHYSDTAMYLAEHGYNDEYMRMLSEAVALAKSEKDKAKGQILTAQAFLFRGELKKALAEFEAADINKIPKHVNSVAVNNYILCLFLLNRSSRINEIYREYNRIALAEDTLVMRRTIGIREYIGKRYENAVEVFVRLLSEPDPRNTLMADICIVRTLLQLDMKDRAAEIAEMGFERYNGKGDITAEVNRLKMKIKEQNPKKRKNAKKRK